MSGSNTHSQAQALRQRAWTALTQGQRESLALFDRAIQTAPGDAELWLGKARALELNGDHRGARIVAQQLADQAPSYLAAQALLAQLRLAAGEENFSSHYTIAAARHPQDPNIPAAQCEVLAGLDYVAEAADIAAQAQRAFPDEPHFALLEALHAGAAGQWDRAETIFAQLELRSTDRLFHEARHRIRGNQVELADRLLTEVLEQWPWDIAAWALRGIAWRLLDDARSEWLHEQAGLVQFRPLEAETAPIGPTITCLSDLHRDSAQPLGQSLRGGSQTRGILLDRPEPELRDLRRAILATLGSYRDDLPRADASHPLLRHRDTAWTLAGSWSVRLSGGGDHHTAHIHPQGIVSSALYLVVPDDAVSGTANGWLEIGRPPTDLGLDLPPLRSVEPKPGHLALFPSTLYHGTTPFSGAERMTVAFDVVAGHSELN